MSADPKLADSDEKVSAKGVVDDVDRRLLAALTADPRQSKSALGRRVGLSTPTVSSRIARLERLGVIRGYRVDLDPAALRYAMTAWVRVSPGPGQRPKIVDLAQRTHEVSECHRSTGDDCFLLRVHAPSLPSLERLLDRFLLHGQTTSAITVSGPVAPRNLSIARARERPVVSCSTSPARHYARRPGGDQWRAPRNQPEPPRRTNR